MARRKRLLQDIEEIKSVFFGKSDSIFKDPSFNDDTLTFSLVDKAKNFSLDLSDYPDCMVSVSGQEEPQFVNGRLLSILENLIKDMGLKSNLIVKSQDEHHNNNKMSTDSDSCSEDSEVGRGLNESGTQWEEDGDENRYKENAKLMLDIENYELIYGKNMIVCKPMPVLDTVEVDMKFKITDLLDAATADAWNVDPSLPIVARISFHDVYYVDTPRPSEIDFFQIKNNSKVKFGLGNQLSSITNAYIKSHWPGITPNRPKVSRYVPPNRISKQHHQQKASESSQDQSNKGFFGRLFGSKSSNQQHKDNTILPELQQLLNMGFSKKMAINALSMTKSVEEAATLLIEHPDSCLSPDTKKASNPPLISKNGDVTRVDELFHSPEKALQADEIKKVSVIQEYGFFVEIMSYLRERIPTLPSYCVICDKPHVFAHGSMLKPSVCSRELCCWSFQQLGVGAGAAEDIATEAEVVDLLVCMTTIAAKSARKEVILEPYPTIFDPKNPKKPVLSPNNKNFNEVISILDKFPAVEKMTQAKDFGDMKKQLDNAHQHAFPLLQWIMSSNRAHIVKLPKDKHIKSMCTPHQYLLLSAPPEKEEKFRMLKKKHGSTFAFHGSSSENWHSILRRGLLNASGTKLQVNGAAYGAGIYLSPNASTSFGYCKLNGYRPTAAKKNSGSGNRFLVSDSIYCIALCEVVNDGIKKTGSIWVQPTADCVVTRFFFVYADQVDSSAYSCDTQQPLFNSEIQKALDYYSKKG
eukprot:TRINITY_DN6660_c0_g5_i1.p1 TRINITY_DN6660_c0_g5~~TRINITY_DN6660_c0_g5_i1.p1  ORF type:complete len:772 (+),score=148.51 TRINITY_DN6660_c0_g5_i1:64-2316(+)